MTEGEPSARRRDGTLRPEATAMNVDVTEGIEPHHLLVSAG